MPKADGYIFVDGQEVAETKQCPHCGAHFQIVRGSGRKRPFCMRCMSPTCLRPQCRACVPFEKKLRIMEGEKVRTFV